MLSVKQGGIKYHFLVFGMTQPGIEPRSPGPLANTLTIMPISGLVNNSNYCRRVRPPLNECPGYDTKRSDDEVPVMLELWGMKSTPYLPSLPGQLWPGVVAPYRALSIILN